MHVSCPARSLHPVPGEDRGQRGQWVLAPMRGASQGYSFTASRKTHLLEAKVPQTIDSGRRQPSCYRPTLSRCLDTWTITMGGGKSDFHLPAGLPGIRALCLAFS